MSKKNIILIILILVLVCMIVVGATFAFFNSSISGNNSFNGSTYKFDADLTSSKVIGGKLVPTVDSLINTSLNSSNPCEGAEDYYLCNVYQVTLTNRGSPVAFTGSIKTNSGTTYVTNNMKYQLYELNNNVYTSVSDAKNLMYSPNSVSTFTLNSNNINVTLNTNQSKTYYLVVWLSDIGSNQLEDADKKYLGTVEFVLSSGERLTANFTV